MKFCKKCNTEKDYCDFHKRSASSDGLASLCKMCQKKYDDARLKNPKRVAARLEYQKTKGKEAHSNACKKWVANNTIKRAAHILINNAVRNGYIIKKNCEICGDIKSNAHHDDYAKPLDVRWLCDTHHKEWHKENGEGLNAR